MTKHKMIKSKMRKTLPLLKDPILSQHVPETHWFSEGKLKKMLESYSSVYVKPNRGRKGLGVSRIRRISASKYELAYEDKKKTLSFPEVVDELVGRFDADKSYIVQQGIDLATYNGGPFHIRIVMQKPMNRWALSLTAAIVAKEKDAVVTNVARGNLEFTVGQVLKHTDQKLDSIQVLRELVDLSHQISYCLGSHFPFRLLGLDMGVDKEGRVWLIEANTNPDCSDLEKINDANTYKKYLQYKKQIFKKKTHKRKRRR
ncbi:YheC/YheD family protein [Bacillus sp. B15-48]|uniref:YheC/YheD family protein n=1 Tax=Bacillus sp. B15-48 TaxID=1548601 RepID=UPI00193F01F1|nr:YheC/YheD family protein [Bacillus sp. B15-48]MBM4761675.1 hypothetical protein [Bacillus sp. B15-48]